MKKLEKKNIYIKASGGGYRDVSVDFLKGWAMLSIVIFHQSSSLFPTWLINFMMNPWNVSIFFIVAGYFLKWEALIHLKTFIKEKLKALYIPATVIYLCSIFLHNTFVHIGWYPLGMPHPATGVPFTLYTLKDLCVGCTKVILCAGSGELIMGAMWFLYTLIYSMIGLSILAWIVNRLCKNEQIQQWVFFLVLLLGAIISCITTQKFGFTINRINIAFTAMFLINIGRLTRQKLNINYDNVWMLLICIILLVQCFILQHIDLVMAKNSYQDIGWLCLGNLSLIYIYTFIAKHCEKSYFVRTIAKIGQNSFYVMALHIGGFFLCNSLLIALGIFKATSEKGLYTFVYGNNVALFVLYTFIGIALPLIIVTIKNKIQHILVK